jgi:hypothetical protein
MNFSKIELIKFIVGKRKSQTSENIIKGIVRNYIYVFLKINKGSTIIWTMNYCFWNNRLHYLQKFNGQNFMQIMSSFTHLKHTNF